MALGLAAAAAFAMSACGGGGAGGKGGDGVNPGLPGGPGTPPSSLQGAWWGPFEIGPDRGDTRMLFLPGGDYWALYGGDTVSGFVIEGFVQGSGVSADGEFSSVNARDFFGSLPGAPGRLEANYTSQSVIGVADFTDWTMAFSGAPIPATTYDFGRPADLADIVGAWPMQTTVDGIPVELTIQPDGSFSGIDSRNNVGPKCQFTGNATPRAGVNVFDVTIVFGSACTLPNQAISGIGLTSTIEGTAIREFLVAGVSGARSYGAALFGTR